MDNDYFKERLTRHDNQIDELRSEYTKLVIQANQLSNKLDSVMIMLTQHKESLTGLTEKISGLGVVMKPKSGFSERFWVAFIGGVTAVLVAVFSGLIEIIKQLFLTLFDK